MENLYWTTEPSGFVNRKNIDKQGQTAKDHYRTQGVMLPFVTWHDQLPRDTYAAFKVMRMFLLAVTW